MGRGAFVLAMAMAAALGCAGRRVPGAGTRLDAGATIGADGGVRGNRADGAGGDRGSADAADGASDGAPGDARAAIFEPADPTLTRLLIAAPASLVGAGTSSCTNGLPYRADAWCAFSRPGAEPDTTELWVFDTTRAVTGGPPVCDGTDTACLRLTTRLWTGTSFDSGSHPTVHRFDGDTLIFLAGDVPATGDLYRGPVWAWRPGWTAARQLTSDRGMLCVGSRRAATVYCVDDAVVDAADSRRLRAFDLRAGVLADVVETGPLPLVEHVAAGGDGDLIWQAAFSSRGERFVYSSATVGAGSSVVKVIDTSSLGTGVPVTVSTDAFAWRVSYDGQRLYHLRGVDLATLPRIGTLATVELDDTGTQAVLATGVVAFDLLGAHEEVVSDVDRGIVVTQYVPSHGPYFSVLLDRTLPDQVVPIPLGSYSPEVAIDRRHTLYYEDETDGFSRLHVVRNDGSGSCSPKRAKASETYGGHFAHTSGLVLWIEYAGDSEEGWSADPETCGDARKFGDYVTGFIPIDDDFVVFQGTDADDSAYHLEYSSLRGDPAAPRVLPRMIERDVDGAVAVLNRGSAVHVLYSLSRVDAPVRGVFAHGPLPR